MDALIVNVSSGLALSSPSRFRRCIPPLRLGLHAYTRCLRVQLEGSNVKVVELAPPLTETPLFTDEFAQDKQGQKVWPFVRHAIAGIEGGKMEIRPGQNNLLKIASRVAPRFMFRQLSKVGRS